MEKLLREGRRRWAGWQLRGRGHLAGISPRVLRLRVFHQRQRVARRQHQARHLRGGGRATGAPAVLGALLAGCYGGWLLLAGCYGGWLLRRATLRRFKRALAANPNNKRTWACMRGHNTRTRTRTHKLQAHAGTHRAGAAKQLRQLVLVGAEGQVLHQKRARVARDRPAGVAGVVGARWWAENARQVGKGP